MPMSVLNLKVSVSLKCTCDCNLHRILGGSDCDTISNLLPAAISRDPHVLQNSLQNPRYYGYRVKRLTFLVHGCALFKSLIAKNRIRMQRNVKRFQRMPVQ